MKKTIVLAALCALGATVAVPAFADNGHRGRDDRYEHRHDNRRDARYERRDDRHDRRYARSDYRYDRYAPRYVARGRYCNDRSHYREVHYHVAPRDYYAYDYPRDAYRLRRGSGLDATVIVTLPLF